MFMEYFEDDDSVFCTNHSRDTLHEECAMMRVTADGCAQVGEVLIECVDANVDDSVG